MSNQPKVAYEETYKRGAMVIMKDHLPVCGHLMSGAVVLSAELLKAGTLDDGTEFQNIRLVIQPPPDTAAKGGE